MIGRTLAHYQILEKLGAGGMGEVYKARDTRLNRLVAIKVLSPDKVVNADRKLRFIQEAQSASALNHPNIVTIYDINEESGIDYMVMEYIAGRTLDAAIPRQGLPLVEALKMAIPIADGLAKAHSAGIIHRDVKPSNIMVAEDGRVKIFDFGLAKLTEPEVGSEDETRTQRAHTVEGAILGTISYMSPEQAEGAKLDARSDIFSFGAVLYEMISGRRAFQGQSNLSTIMAILKDDPSPLKTLREGVPDAVERIVHRCLAKNLADRYGSAADVRQDLTAVLERVQAPPDKSWRARAAIATLALVLASGGGWFWHKSSRSRWAREVALSEITRLTTREQTTAALLLARQAARYIPGDGALTLWFQTWSRTTTIRTDPPGANIYLKDYMTPDAEWALWGGTPLENVLVPDGHVRFRIAKEGYETVEGGRLPARQPLTVTLVKTGQAPPGMVFVPGGQYQFRNSPTVTLGDYWIDRFEITNKEYQVFIDQGGYKKRDYWRIPFLKNGGTLSWEEAIAEFRDATGMPGPSTWDLGHYPQGQDDVPVHGVSWYEAAAYAAFAGKSLPTVYHWYRAAGALGPGFDSDVIRLSNFDGAGPAPRGKFAGTSPSGALDMAGNVAEWTWNVRGETRYLNGGAWSDPAYVFVTNSDAQPPFERRPTSGFRCVKYLSDPPSDLLKPVDLWFTRDYSKEKPADDATFGAYRSFYRYDKQDLESKVDSVDDSPEFWRKETVSYTAAYGGERVIAHLFLPKAGKPPYQPVIWFPGQNALLLADIEPSQYRWFDFIIRSGRALLFPIYKGTYQRRITASYQIPSVRRDLTVQWAKDLRRSIDYLEKRPDIDATRLAYYGFSRGATDAPIYAALEPRLKTMVLLSGGFPLGHPMPEADPINFAPRAKIPALMINGRYDFNYPVEQSQKYLYRWLGAPEKDKRHVLLDGGHSPTHLQSIVKEALAWLDKYLGPVQH